MTPTQVSNRESEDHHYQKAFCVTFELATISEDSSQHLHSIHKRPNSHNMTAAVYDASETAVMRRSRHSSSPIRSHQGVLKSISSAKMAIVLLLSIASTMLTGTPTALATGTSPSLLILKNGTSTPASLLDTRAAEMPVGSPCYASEGEWNCLTTSFQRCASGQWSDITDTADGTICVRPPSPRAPDCVPGATVTDTVLSSTHG